MPIIVLTQKDIITQILEIKLVINKVVLVYYYQVIF